MRGAMGTGTMDSAGIYVSSGGNISAAGGNIIMNGLIESNSSATGGAFRALRIGGASTTPFPTVTTTGTGTITMTGKTSKASSIEQAVLLENATISAVNGDVSLTADANAGANSALVAVTGDSTVSTSGTGNVSITSTTATSGGENLGNLIVNSGGNLTFTAPTFTLPKAWTAAGNMALTASAGDMTLNANLSVTGAAKTLTLKSTGNLIQGASTVSTNGGAALYWSDTDAATARGGGIVTAATSSIATSGGALTLSGGTDYTTSWAKGTSSTNETGVYLSGGISTGAGAIVIRGEEAATTTTTRQGVMFNAGSSTAATSGTITVNGKVDATNTDTANNHYGIFTGANDAAHLATITTTTGDINMLGDSTGNANVNRRGILMYKATVSSATGAITMDGRATTTSNCMDLWFLSGNNTVSSTSGAITIKGSAGSTTTLETATISSGGSVTLQLSKPSVAASNTVTLGGTGDKVIEPPAAATDFAAAVTTTGFSFGTTSKSIRIGTATVTQALTVTSAIAAAGPISLLANSASFAKTAGLDTTGLVGSAILVKTRMWIQADSQDSAAAATKFVTDNGDITFWTVSAGGTDGSVTIGNYTVLDSTNGRRAAQATGGGRITIAGGTATSNGYPTGPTMGGTNNSYGICIYNYIRIYSGGGDQYLYGKSPSGNYFGYRSGGDFIADSGQGQITVRGDNTSSAEWAATIGEDNVGDTVFLSKKTTGTAIDISANAPSYAALSINRYGTTANVYVVANGGGAINMTGNGAGSWVGLALDRTQVLSTSGKITLDGGPSWLGVGYMSRGEVYIGSKAGSSYVTSSTADVLLKATTYIDSDNTTTTAINTGGNVVAESAGTSFSSTSYWGIPTTSGSFRYGKTTEVQDVTLSAAVNSTVNGSTTGAVSVYGKNVTSSASLSGTSVAIAPTAAYSGAGALTATAGAVSISGGTSVAPTGAISATGNITLSGSANISTATGATLTSSTAAIAVNTTGGSVTLDKAVSAQTSIGVTLTGAYAGAGSLTAGSTISISGGTSIAPTANLQAGGNISMSGSGQGYFNGVRVNSTSGGISLTSGPYAGHAVQIQNSTFSATTSPITISGTGTSGEGVYILSASTISTTTGNININGVGSDWGVYLAAADITSSSGAIKIDGGARGIVDGYGATTNFGAIPTGSSSSNITVVGDRNWSGSTQVNFRTTGAVSLDSKAADFIEAPSYINHKFDGCSSVSIAHLSAAWQVTVQATATLTGQFSVQGQYVVINANSSIKTTMAKSAGATRNTGILLKANDKVYTLSTVAFETGGADVTFWSDADNNGVGSIYLSDTNTVKSAGGNITMAGGLDDGAALNSEITGRTANDGAPDNYAEGVSGFGQNAGVDILTNYQVNSGGGDVFIAGQGSAVAGDDDYGVSLRGGLMYSDAGKIAVFGKAPTSCTANWHRGIALTWGGDGGTADYLVSNSSATDAIRLIGDTSSCNSGGSVYAQAIEGYYSSGAYIATPNGGGITLSGKQGNASAVGGSWSGGTSQESDILELNYVNVVSNSGPITITGARVSGTGNHSVRFNTRGTGQANSLGALSAAKSTGFTAYPSIGVTSSSSDVSVTGDSIVLWSTTVRNTGNLTLQPNSASFDRTQNFSSDWGASFPTTYKNVVIGKAGTSGANQNSADVYLDKMSATGDISVYGGTLGLKGGVTTSESSGNGIIVKATQDVVVYDGSSATRTPVTITGTASTAPVYLWSNADASGTGAVKVGNYTDITSQGGPIYLGGSTAATDTAPTTYALNNGATYTAGVALGTSAAANGSLAITSNGGDITIRGKTTYDGGGAWASWPGVV